jgi:hypothetical protein
MTKPPVTKRTTALSLWQRAVMTATQAVEEMQPKFGVCTIEFVQHVCPEYA